MKNIIKNKISEEFQKEYNQYNQFLDEENISVLPNNYFKGVKELNYKEVRKLYDLWRVKNNKNG